MNKKTYFEKNKIDDKRKKTTVCFYSLDFKQYLSSLKGRTIYYRPNPGNGGDALIAAGTVRLLRELELDFVLVDENMDLAGKTVLLGGGGNLTEHYEFCAEFIRKWHRQASALILAPHTVCSHRRLFSELTGNTVLFCREKKSYEYVRSAVSREVRVFLDHDLAFHLHPEELVANFSGKPIYLYLRTLIRKRFRQCGTLHVFREDSERTAVFPPSGNIDISTKLNYNCEQTDLKSVERSVREIFYFINLFDRVHTNRLHIAIAACLLRKKVFLYPNSYYKNKAVYEFSLAERGNVYFQLTKSTLQ